MDSARPSIRREVEQRINELADQQNPVSFFLEPEVNVSTRNYRLTVVGCALAWFLVGLHIPSLHGMTHDGQTPHWGVVAITLLLGIGAVAGLWALLRSPDKWSKASG
jgi:hypothetical protein